MHAYTIHAITQVCTHVCTGNGANMAFVDAWQLALQLTSPDHLTLEEAIAAYDAESAPRCTAAVHGGSANIARWHRQGFAYHMTLVVYFLLGRLLQVLVYFGLLGSKQTSKGRTFLCRLLLLCNDVHMISIERGYIMHLS